METLYSLFPSADDLLKVRHDDLAPILLKITLPQLQSAGFIPSAVTQVSAVDAANGKDYPHHKRHEIERLINRAWNWMEREGFIEPSPGMNGQHGWRLLTDKGMAVANGQDMQRLRAATDFPKGLLHPIIREHSWAAIMRSSNATAQGDLVGAIRAAFVAVEEAVRAAGKYKESLYGKDLIEAAFHPDTGPLGDKDAGKPMGERKALMDLFKGAMAAYRNPVSHRTPLIELEEAQDQLLLASHLLRIVDVRRKP